MTRTGRVALFAAATSLAVAGCAVYDDADLAPVAGLKVLDAPAVPVFRDGRALPVVAADSARAVGAAIQLADVVRRATGVKPAVLREFRGSAATNRPALFVGATAAAEAAGLSAPDDSPEAFRVVSDGGSMFFLGREDFAVFDWCERQLGARCYCSGPDGDEMSVPRVSEVLAAPVDYSDRPAFAMRSPGSSGAERWARFAKAGSSHRGGVQVHVPREWHRDAALVAEMPGIFALDSDGRRAASPLLCYGNPETLAYYERRIDEAIGGVRDSGGIVDVRRKVISVSPWDAAYNCACGFCAPLYDESLGEGGRASPIVWGRFLKGLAGWAREKHPDYLVSFLPYWNMREAPPGLDLREEGNCEAEVCIMPGLALMKEESVKRREEALVRRWTEVTGRKAVLWHYTCWPAESTSAPYLFGGTIRRHWLDMRGLADGCFICSGGEASRLLPTHYVWMRCMWNPDVDVGAVYDVFAERMFGPAAKPMRRLMALQEEGWSRRWTGEAPSDGNVFGISYQPGDVREMKRLLVSADRLAARDPSARRRVRRYASSFADFFEDAAKVHSGAPRPVLQMVRAGSAPEVDGILDDGCWAKAPPLGFVRATDRVRAAPRHPGEARGAWLDDGIALAFLFEEPAVASMPSGMGVDDHCGQDLVNVFLSDAASRTGAVWRVRFDADGRLGLFEGSSPRPAGGARVAVRKGDSSWSAELFVPFSAFGGRPARLVGNVSRRRPGADGEWTRLSTRFSTFDSDPNAFVDMHLTADVGK